MTKIEQIARAIYEATPWCGAADDIIGEDESGRPIEAWTQAIPQARAALAAMLEPSDLMGNGLPAGYRPGTHSAAQIWRAMIDAAMGEEG